ncbi:hypothetical protein [Pseudonocardia sp. ICBG1034]|jgi:hypothetical protein|uniref:hypothetical protein n=1 Tax=Pseudonocardia sp. ICBG1034 TaxID=2844381 RepID=UPI001CC99602|nr:hypothetical protein [Pseudonocardia sp. ICBG1034]
MRRIADMGCEGGNCPNTYATDRGTIVVQGDAVSGDTDAVVVPHELLHRHAHATGQPDWPWTISPAGADRVLVRGRQVTDPIVLNTIKAPSHENLVELDQEAIA